jgi:hypothetical protein
VHGSLRLQVFHIITVVCRAGEQLRLIKTMDWSDRAADGDCKMVEEKALCDVIITETVRKEAVNESTSDALHHFQMLLIQKSANNQ